MPHTRLQPRGMTALYDAIGRACTELGARLAARPEDERPGTVIVAIMTDGQENHSREWMAAAVKARIKQQEETYGWQFLFMGAGADAYAEAAQVGINPDRAVQFSRGRSDAVYAATSRVVGSLRQARAAGAPVPADGGYSAEERHVLGTER